MFTLVTGENGLPFQPMCPPKKHGTLTGYTHWLCRCDPCSEANRASALKSYYRRKHNSLILMEMRMRHEGSAGGDPSPAGAAEVADPSQRVASTTPEVDEPAAAPPDTFAEAFLAEYESRFRRTS